MLAENVLVIDTDARHWINLLKLFQKDDRPAYSILLCLLDGDRCIKAIHSEKGPLWGFAFPGKDELAKAAELAGAEYVLCLPRGALQEIFYRGQINVRPTDDYVQQILTIVTGVHEALKERAIWYPEKPYSFEPPSFEKIRKLFDSAWPDGTTVGFFVFEGTTPYTSLILGKESGQISLITSLDALGMADQSLDFRMAANTFGEMIAQRFSPLHTALFIELSALNELRAGAYPLSYLHLAEKRGRALLWPKPFKLRLMLWLARVFRGL